VAGGAVSASSATNYIESVAGVEQGGRTGLVSVVTGALCQLALPLVNLVNAIPPAATAPALIVVGILMVGILAEDVKTVGSAAGAEQSSRQRIDWANLDVWRRRWS
jgi:adenine/guanine/hypoxanthine permease